MHNDLDPAERDMLLETASMAAGKTITPISNIVGQLVAVAPPELLMTSLEKIADSLGKPEEKKTAVFIRILGEAKGAVMLLVNPDDVAQLLPNVADDLKNSALEEMTNIVAGASLGGLSRFLNMLFLQSVPVSTTDMLRAIVNEVVAEVGDNDSQLLTLVIALKIGETNIPVSIYLMFDTNSKAAIISAGKHLIEGLYGSVD